MFYGTKCDKLLVTMRNRKFKTLIKMKTRNLIFTLAITAGMIASSNVFAIDPISFSTDMAVSKTEMIVEKDIKVQDWMLTADFDAAKTGVSSEKSLVLENWMIDGNWSKNNNVSKNTPEAELKVESWMLNSFVPEKENTQGKENI